MDPTIDYYDNNGHIFVKDTVAADMSPAQQRFLAYLPAGARLLDLGCGSGRDSKAFIERGYSIEAVDGSAAMCRAASGLIGQPVRQLLFAELDYEHEFDGIWASASLLHVPSSEISSVLAKVVRALKPGGYLYVSVKQGDFEGWRNGRYFIDYSEESIGRLLKEAGLELIETWVSQDVRPDRSEMWVNVVGRK